MSSLTFLPVIAWPLVVAGAIALLVAIWWSRGQGRTARAWQWRMSAAVVALAVAALRPGIPGGVAEVSSTRLNVYFVIDTTPSSLAEDFGDGQTRLRGMQRDILALAQTMPGARFSLVTFDSDTRVRLPLSSDTTALQASVSTLTVEMSRSSGGSSVTQARERLAQTLEQSRQRHPDRARVVFYLGDGEQTAASVPEPFTLQPGDLDGGAVLGYGSPQGGQMREQSFSPGVTGLWVRDPKTGEPATSVPDEARLREIAGQLAVPYIHRAAGEPIEAVTDAVSLSDAARELSSDTERIANRQELYWIFLVPVALLVAWELGLLTLGLRALRPRRAAQPEPARAVAAQQTEQVTA